jgi:peroxiredoxin
MHHYCGRICWSCNGTETITTTQAALAVWIDESLSFMDAQGYKKVPQDANSIQAWQGYWLWCNQQGLRLYLPSQPQADDGVCRGAICRVRAGSGTVKVGTQPGLPAPISILADTLGNRVSLADFRGKDVLLVFGNTQCPNCRGKLPLLNVLHKNGDFEVVYVVLGATPKAAVKFVSDNKIAFTVLVDSNQLVGRIYGITMIPEAFVIDPSGLIQHQTTTEGPALWYLLAGQTIPESMLPDK